MDAQVRLQYSINDITIVEQPNIFLSSQVASADPNNALHITLNALSLCDGQSRMDNDGHSQACDPELLKKSLMARWRYPTFTVHKIDVSLNNPTIIPRQATAAISMRIVPDQDIHVICEQFELFVEKAAKSLGTDNKVTVIYRRFMNWCKLTFYN
jgi:acetylornithine deacetylase/succinyl-diaminopimelate desuccinylase-like protein